MQELEVVPDRRDVEMVKTRQVEVSGFTGLFYNPFMYGDGTGEHWNHLSDRGNVAFLCTLWTAWGQGLRDEQDLYDCHGVRELIYVPPYVSVSYFKECDQLRRKASRNTANLANLRMADSTCKHSVNVDSLDVAIKDLSYPRADTVYARSHNRGQRGDGQRGNGVSGGKNTKKPHHKRGGRGNRRGRY